MKGRLVPRLSLLLLLALCLSGVSNHAQAQIDSLIYYQDYKIDRSAKGQLTFEFDNIDFVRNNEYDGKRTKGYTLPGFWVQPSLGFQPLSNLKIEAGLYLLRYWGANKYPCLNYSDVAEWKGNQYQKGFHLLPFFRVQVALTKNFDIVLGNLYGKNNHNLDETIYNKEIALTGDPEAGLQLLWKTKPMDFDMWVNWESFIFNADEHQESFSFGVSTHFKANQPDSKIHFYFPLQVLFQHRGGEINTEAENRSIKTWLNAAAGIGMDWHFHNRIFKKLNVEMTGTYFGQQAGDMLPFKKGYGIYPKVTADIHRFKVYAAYWQCKDFITIFGNPLFGAISVTEAGHRYDKPKMVLAGMEYSQSLGKGFAWGVHADIYNTFAVDAYGPDGVWYKEKGFMNFAAGIYFRINPSFLIKTF